MCQFLSITVVREYYNEVDSLKLLGKKIFFS